MRLRLKELKISPETKSSWKSACEAAVDSVMSDFEEWPLYEAVGEPWPNAPKMFRRLTSIEAAMKSVRSHENYKWHDAANPGLKMLYMNLSTLLCLRSQDFHYKWKESAIRKRAKSAYTKLAKRIKLEAVPSDERYWVGEPGSHLRKYVWEQLHHSILEAPFYEHILSIYRAGHVPVGFEGRDWKHCRFLYY
jgi:hypothetical protein